jgi:hypothetical protein
MRHLAYLSFLPEKIINFLIACSYRRVKEINSLPGNRRNFWGILPGKCLPDRNAASVWTPKTIGPKSLYKLGKGTLGLEFKLFLKNFRP